MDGSTRSHMVIGYNSIFLEIRELTSVLPCIHFLAKLPHIGN